MSPTFSAPGFADDLNPDLRNCRHAVIDTEFDRPPAPRSPVRQHGRPAETVRTRGRRPEAAAARATAGGLRPPDDRPREAADLTGAGVRGTRAVRSTPSTPCKGPTVPFADPLGASVRQFASGRGQQGSARRLEFGPMR